LFAYYCILRLQVPKTQNFSDSFGLGIMFKKICWLSSTEEVKSFVRVTVFYHVLCYFIKIKRTNSIVVKGGNKFQMPMIGKREYLPERAKAIDAFLT
ncbi:MAG: hypothetical protein ACK41Q_12730, partial [Candidatus Brocadia sp.]